MFRENSVTLIPEVQDSLQPRCPLVCLNPNYSSLFFEWPFGHFFGLNKVGGYRWIKQAVGKN